MSQTVEIYGPKFSNFVRSVQLVCEEKGIDHSVGYSLLGEQIEFKSERYMQLHPFGKLPLLAHGDRVLAETMPICRYLDKQFEGPSLQPTDTWQLAQHDQWCALVNYSVDQAVVRNYLLELAFPKGEDGKPRMDHLAANKAAAVQALEVMSAQLADKQYLMGDQFTLADCLFGPIACYSADLPAAVALLQQGSPLHTYAHRLRARASGAKIHTEYEGAVKPCKQSSAYR